MRKNLFIYPPVLQKIEKEQISTRKFQRLLISEFRTAVIEVFFTYFDEYYTIQNLKSIFS